MNNLTMNNLTAEIKDLREHLEEQDAEVLALTATMRLLAQEGTPVAWAAYAQVQKISRRICLERITTRSVLGEKIEEGRALLGGA